MSQLNSISSQHPLDGIVRTGVFGKADINYPGIYFDIPSQVKIIRLMPFQGKAHAVNLVLQDFLSISLPPAGKFTQKDDVTIGWSAKNRWYIMASAESNSITFCELKKVLTGLASVSDASQGLIQILIDGDDSPTLMSKGCVLNLDYFLSGDSAPSLMAHTNVHIRRLSDRKFEILVPASHAASFWEWLCISAAEFGYKVKFKTLEQVEKADVSDLSASRPLKFG